jgi:hypothetical protein
MTSNHMFAHFRVVVRVVLCWSDWIENKYDYIIHICGNVTAIQIFKGTKILISLSLQAYPRLDLDFFSLLGKKFVFPCCETNQIILSHNYVIVNPTMSSRVDLAHLICGVYVQSSIWDKTCHGSPSVIPESISAP